VKIELKVIIVRHFVLFASNIGPLAEKLLVGISKGSGGTSSDRAQTVANSFNIYLSYNFFSNVHVRIGSGAHTTSYPVGTRGFSPG
jgi:hypothetical protein